MSHTDKNRQVSDKPPAPKDERHRQSKDFEHSMQELEALVDKLEQGDLTLEQSLAAFERGINLTRTCQQALDAAEQRVRILTERSETAEPEPYSNDVITRSRRKQHRQRPHPQAMNPRSSPF
jgi:exodeoxyribonuclease VII small subunit